MNAVLGSVQFDSPLMWAVVIGWILTVVLHEFGHGVVAHWGGDYTIRERGGLTLNPIQYIDPVMSVILPLVFLMMGGLPLPGASTFVRRDLLRSRGWESAVSLGGPAVNLLLFVGMVGLMHPAVGWFDLNVPAAQWSNGQLVWATVALLQAISFVLNLIPWPPVDGFNALAPYLPPVIVERARTPVVTLLCLVVYFSVITGLPGVWRLVGRLLSGVVEAFGISPLAVPRMLEAYEITLR